MTDKHFCLDDSPWFRMVELGEVTSTNDFLKAYRPLEERRITLVTAEHQTAGRGAGQNRWESQSGQNLLFSLLVHPRHIPAHRMFVLSEVLALAIREAINYQLSNRTADGLRLACPRIFNFQLKIKWPNDIYYGDRKLCGMLIENELRGQTVERCVLGVGINVNQTTFESDAPNPVSLAQILGCEVERRFVLEAIMEHFTRYYEWTEQGRFDELHEMYLANLYRRDELHRFCDAGGEFLGTIVDVEPTGHLIIVDEAGDRRRYAFKEVEYIIKEK